MPDLAGTEPSPDPHFVVVVTTELLTDEQASRVAAQLGAVGLGVVEVVDVSTWPTVVLSSEADRQTVETDLEALWPLPEDQDQGSVGPPG